MKKSIVSIIIISLGMAFASCKKEYNCECKRTHTDNSGNSVTTTEANYTYKDTRTRAESRCEDNERTGSDTFGDYSIDCSIK